MPFAGGTDVISLVIDGAGLDTTVATHLVGPSGQVLDPTPISSDERRTWTAVPGYDEAGKWTVKWTITGTGADVVYQEIQVSRIPVAGATVGWRPERWDVGAYVPGRTLVGAVDGYGHVIYTFDDTTMPTGAAVDRLITGAVAWVETGCGALLGEQWWESAKACAAMRAAALIELTFPRTEKDVDTSAQLLKAADAMREDLRKAIVGAGGDDPTTDADDVLPVFSFPAASPWGDLLL